MFSLFLAVRKTNEIPTICVDKAGYTGNDLLNPEQPFYVLGSVDLSEEESQDILFEMCDKFKLNLHGAQELKIVYLKR